MARGPGRHSARAVAVLPLSKRRALEAILRRNYRVSFARSDDRGVAEYTRDVTAIQLVRAVEQVQWQLEQDHRSDWAAYRCVRAVEIDRTDAEIAGAAI